MKINHFSNFILLLLLVLSCENNSVKPNLCDVETEADVWGECYNIETTTSLYRYDERPSSTLPSELFRLINLEQLGLSQQNLIGEIPPEIENLTNLEVLILDNNSLSGSLPSQIWNLSNLRNLFLHRNELSGELSSDISNLTNLHYLSLSHNDFSGELPSEIGNMPNLVDGLHINDNNFSGEIPSEICNLSNLDSSILNCDSECVCPPTWTNGLMCFSIYNNQFCPPYPECVQPYIDDDENAYDNYLYQDTSNCSE